MVRPDEPLLLVRFILDLFDWLETARILLIEIGWQNHTIGRCDVGFVNQSIVFNKHAKLLSRVELFAVFGVSENPLELSLLFVLLLFLLGFKLLFLS